MTSLLERFQSWPRLHLPREQELSSNGLLDVSSVDRWSLRRCVTESINPDDEEDTAECHTMQLLIMFSPPKAFIDSRTLFYKHCQPSAAHKEVLLTGEVFAVRVGCAVTRVSFLVTQDMYKVLKKHVPGVQRTFKPWSHPPVEGSVILFLFNRDFDARLLDDGFWEAMESRTLGRSVMTYRMNLSQEDVTLINNARSALLGNVHLEANAIKGCGYASSETPRILVAAYYLYVWATHANDSEVTHRLANISALPSKYPAVFENSEVTLLELQACTQSGSVYQPSQPTPDSEESPLSIPKRVQALLASPPSASWAGLHNKPGNYL